MSFEGKDILSTEDMTKEEILEIMKVAEKMEDICRTQHVSDLLADKMVAVIFLEPSTRTRLSFETAVKRLGAKSITVADAKSSSAAKGETLADTARTVEGYVDCIVVRQPAIGGAKLMADAVSIPFAIGVNAVFMGVAALWFLFTAAPGNPTRSSSVVSVTSGS